MESMRAFIAIDIGSDIRARLNKLQQKLKLTAADIRWVKPENMHLTLAFLGQVSLEELQPLEKTLGETIQRQEPFALRIQGTGVFGRRSRPSVVWAGTTVCPPLLELHQKVVAAVKAAHIDYHENAYRPHLTLGRFKSLNHLDPLFQTLDKEQEADFGLLEVRSIQIIKSELKPSGAEYTVLHRFELT